MNPTITHLRELLSKATPGHWVFEAMLQTPGHGFIDAHKDRHAQSVMKNDRDVDEVAIKLEDGLLIVAAVNALPALLDRLAKLERAFALARIMNAADISRGHAMGCAYDGPRSKCDCEWVEYIHAQHDFAALANGEEP